jgi:signal transduction histidine kinase
MLDGSNRQLGAICVLETGISADRIGKMTSDIVRSISHELRNPLTSLVGNIQLLQRHIQGSEPVDLTYVTTRVDRLEASSKQLNTILKARE